jgi:biopolymer transport protein ExbD
MSVSGKRGRRGALHREKKTMDGVMSDINVTPLIDVVLVLLIIFMVITPMLSRGVDVDLPKSKNHESKNDTGEQLIISIKEKGDVYWETTKVDMTQLKTKLEDALKKRPGAPIFLKADQKAKYKVAREVLETCQKAGAGNVALGTNEDKG